MVVLADVVLALVKAVVLLWGALTNWAYRLVYRSDKKVNNFNKVGGSNIILIFLGIVGISKAYWILETQMEPGCLLDFSLNIKSVHLTLLPAGASEAPGAGGSRPDGDDCCAGARSQDRLHQPGEEPLLLLFSEL